MCGCGRIDSKDPHLLIKPPLKDNQIVSEVRPSQRHVHSDGITIVCLHPKCRMLPAMTFSLITIACLLTPVTSEILVPRMQVRAERSSWNAVRLRAEAPRNARTDHELWLEGRIGRIADIKVAPASNCYEHDDKTFIPPISTLLETSMEIYCLDQTTVTVRGTLFRDIRMHYHRQPAIPCLRQLGNTTITELLIRFFRKPHSMTRKTPPGDTTDLWCFDANVTTASISRAIKDNAFFAQCAWL